jgi:hypothetical protein
MQGLKPPSFCWHFAAWLKQCPDTSHSSKVFPKVEEADAADLAQEFSGQILRRSAPLDDSAHVEQGGRIIVGGWSEMLTFS